jgi:hypothetical protein
MTFLCHQLQLCRERHQSAVDRSRHVVLIQPAGDRPLRGTAVVEEHFTRHVRRPFVLRIERTKHKILGT